MQEIKNNIITPASEQLSKAKDRLKFLLAYTGIVCVLALLTVMPSIADTIKNSETDPLEAGQEQISEENLPEEAVSAEEPEPSQFENAVMDPNATAAFTIDWYRDYNTASKSFSTPVYYQGTSNGGSSYTEIDPFVTFDYNLRRDFVANESKLKGTETYRESHFDVRYFEDTYTTTDAANASHKWAYCGSYIEVGSTRYDMTKCAFRYSSNKTYLHYLNDLTIDGWDVSGSISATDLQNVKIYILFKELTSLSIDAIDFYTYWGTTTTSTTPHAVVQYMYHDPNDTGNKFYKHMDPPFAGNLFLSPTSSTSSSSSNTMTFSNYCGRFVHQNVVDTGGTYSEIKDCVYSGAAICTPTAVDEQSHASWHVATKVWYSSGDKKWRYIDDEGNTKTLKTYDASYQETNTDYTGTDIWINFIYEFGSDHVTPSLDYKDHGVKVEMFDYDTWLSAGSTSRYRGGINYHYKDPSVVGDADQDNAFHFASGSYDSNEKTWNYWTGHDLTNGYFRRVQNDHEGIWKNALVDGYPVMVDKFKDTNVDGYKSLRYLFDPNTDNIFKRSYPNLNGFFDKQAYEEYGYYLYGSSTDIHMGSSTFPGRFAQVRKKPGLDTSNAATNDVVLYKNVSDQTGRGSNSAVYFMPFNDKDNPSASNDDFHFGMTIEATFLMPKDGISLNTGTKGSPSPMIFHFDGDDDVFVYVDGVLMLDLGGIHQKVAGDINYKTGQVIILENWSNTSKSYSKETIVYMDDMYKMVYPDYVFADHPDEWTPLESSPDGKQHYRYADYTTHKMNFYYMERGTGESNCEIVFNLETMPEDAIAVGKTVENGASSVSHIDGEFTYKVQVEEYNKETKEYGDIHDYYGRYSVYKGVVGAPGAKVRDGYCDKDTGQGLITIKDGEVAYLEGFKVLDRFTIAEFDPRETTETGSDILDLLWQVRYNAHDIEEQDTIYITYIDKDGNPQRIKAYGTGELYVGKDNGIQFFNKVSDNSLFDLIVEKEQATAGQNIENANIKLCFNGQTDEEGRPVGAVPYVGEYWYVDTAGSNFTSRQVARMVCNTHVRI